MWYFYLGLLIKDYYLIGEKAVGIHYSTVGTIRRNLKCKPRGAVDAVTVERQVSVTFKA